MSERWFVIDSDGTDDLGRGPVGLSIGPNEGDHADAFAFSENFHGADGVPEAVQAKFALMAAAPEMLAALEMTAAARRHFAACMRCGGDLSGNVWFCGEHNRLAAEAARLGEAALKQAKEAPHA